MKREKRSAPEKEDDGEDWEQTRKVNIVNTTASRSKLCRRDACGLMRQCSMLAAVFCEVPAACRFELCLLMLIDI